METKEHIRKLALEKRNSLSLNEKLYKSDKILEFLITTSYWKNAKYILAYADFKNEVMTDKLILTAILEGKEVYLPKIEDNEMSFYRIYSLEELISGYFGIREPIGLLSEKINPEDIDDPMLIIVPGTAFDIECNRIGYGKGFYDKYLKQYELNNTIGLAFECQIFDEVPHTKQDEALSYLITENRIIENGKG